MENTSSLGPVTVEATSIEESITFLKEEVVSNKLVTLGFGHTTKRVESASKLSFESVASLDDLLLNLIALLSGDSRAKWVVSEVTTDSDASRLDHCGILRWEWWALELGMIHVADMASILVMTVVLLNNLVHKRGKSCVRVVAASVYTDA